MKARRKRNLGVYVVFHRMAIGYRYMESFKTSGIIGYLHGQSTTKTQGPPKFFFHVSAFVELSLLIILVKKILNLIDKCRS